MEMYAVALLFIVTVTSVMAANKDFLMDGSNENPGQGVCGKAAIEVLDSDVVTLSAWAVDALRIRSNERFCKVILMAKTKDFRLTVSFSNVNLTCACKAKLKVYNGNGVLEANKLTTLEPCDTSAASVKTTQAYATFELERESDFTTDFDFTATVRAEMYTGSATYNSAGLVQIVLMLCFGAILATLFS